MSTALIDDSTSSWCCYAFNGKWLSFLAAGIFFATAVSIEKIEKDMSRLLETLVLKGFQADNVAMTLS